MEDWHISFYNQKQGKVTKKKMQSIFFDITDPKLATGAFAASALKHARSFIENKEWDNLPPLLKKDLSFTIQADIVLFNEYLALQCKGNDNRE